MQVGGLENEPGVGVCLEGGEEGEGEEHLGEVVYLEMGVWRAVVVSFYEGMVNKWRGSFTEAINSFLVGAYALTSIADELRLISAGVFMTIP